MSLVSFRANLSHAIATNESVSIGGGRFDRDDLRDVLARLDAADSENVAPSEFGPYSLSAETRADLAELEISDSPHALDLARNIREWLAGRDHAPAAVIASARLLDSNAALSRTAGATARDLLAKLAESAANVAGSMNADALAATGLAAANDSVKALSEIADGASESDWPKLYNGVTLSLSAARRLADAVGSLKASNATLTASLAQADRTHVERAAAIRQAVALSQADAKQLAGSPFAAARIAARYLAAFDKNSDVTDLQGATDALVQLEAQACGKAIEAREATEALHALQNVNVANVTARAVAERDSAIYRDQRDAANARAVKAERALEVALGAIKPVMAELGGLTLSMLPAGAYGGALADAYSTARKTLAL